MPMMEENGTKSVFSITLSSPMTGGLHFRLLIVCLKVWRTLGVLLGACA